MTPDRDARTHDIPLAAGEVHIWVIALNDPDKRRRRELAHLAEGMLLASYLGLTPAMLEYERGPGGKPRLRGEPLQYNLSHSESLALVGVSRDLPLGVDIQGPHPNVAKPWFAKRICSPREFEHFGGRPGADDLIRLWVRKEAVIKARGEGSYVAVGEIDVLEDRIAGGWLCRDLELEQAPPGFHGAVVVADSSCAGTPEVVVTTRAFSWR